MKNKIPYGRQNITQEDIQAVVKVLQSEWLTQGPSIKEFEINFAEYVGSKYAVAVSNGTAALHLSALAMNVKKGDKVITTPITFAATANSVRYCGGDIIFGDIDPETYLLDIKSVRSLLETDSDNEIKGIIPVNFAGRVVNMEQFRQLANEFGCWIIEDACHSPGGYFCDSNSIAQLAGNGEYADVSIFSFHPVKHIAAGEGGMITTNNEGIYKRLLNLRSHGVQQDFSKRIFDDSLWYYEMQELGYNYRLTDIQAALANSQLQRAEIGLKKRQEIARKYKAFFADKNYIKGQSGTIDGHAYHLYVIEVERRKELHSHLRDSNIFAQIHYIPLHLMPYYRDLGWKEGEFPVAEAYYMNCISLPMYPTITDEELEFVMSTIDNFYNQA